MQRSKERFYFPFLAVWNGSISISFFYFTGLLDTIGSSQSIPYMMAGTVTGSLFYPLLAAAWFGRSRRGVILSLPVAAIVFAAIALYVLYNLILNGAETLLLSFLCPAGTLFRHPCTTMRGACPLVSSARLFQSGSAVSSCR